jgi:hypothetical protein
MRRWFAAPLSRGEASAASGGLVFGWVIYAPFLQASPSGIHFTIKDTR